MFSSVTGKRVAAPLPLEYWRQNLESPVLFSQAAQSLLRSVPGIRCVVEVGPHSALGGPVKEIRAALGRGEEQLQYLSALKRNTDGVETVLNLVGALFLSGHSVALDRVNADELVEPETGAVRLQRGPFLTDFPRYQWVYDDVYWSESRLSSDVRFRKHARHDLLGSLLPGSSKASPSWRNVLKLDQLPWLRDHKVGGDIVFPAAGYISLAMTAAAQASGLHRDSPTYTLGNVKIKSAMVLKEGVGTESLLDLYSLNSDGTEFDFTVSSVCCGEWAIHASGNVRISKPSALPAIFTSKARATCTGVNQETQDRRWYQKMRDVGLAYGPAFKTLSGIRSTADRFEALADVDIEAPGGSMVQESEYAVHPTVLDACLQLSIIAAHRGEPNNLVKSYLPVAVEHMTVATAPSTGRAVVRGLGRPNGLRSIKTAVELTGADGDVLVQARLSFLSLESSINSQSEAKIPQPYSRLVWKPDISRLSGDQLRSVLSDGQSCPSACQVGSHAKLEKLADLIAHQDPRLNILELNGGEGPSRRLLTALRGHHAIPNYVKYRFADESAEFLASVQEQYRDFHKLEFARLDMEQDPSPQGFDEASYDIIFAPNVVHAKRSLAGTLKHCRKLLKPGGRLIMIETVTASVMLSKAEWNQRLVDAGFSGADVMFDYPEPGSCSALIVTRPDEQGSTIKGTGEDEDEVVLLYRHEPHALLVELEKLYHERSVPSRRMAFTDLPQSGIQKARTVMLAELEGPLLSRMSEAEMAAMRAYTQLASTAVWVTNGDVLAGREPEKTLVFGISKSIMTEQPSFHLASIDIDPDAALASSARLVVDMEAEFRRNPHDMNTELVEKGGVVYSSRYMADDDGNAAFARSWMPPTERLPIRGNLSMGFDRVGRLDSFHFEDVSGAETALGETDVLVEARAFAFDQTGLAVAKGQKSHPFFTLEAGGIVAKTGSQVHGIRPGDAVVCLKPNTFETTLAVHQDFVSRLDGADGIDDIVSQLLPYTFAVHTLAHVCRPARHDAVLVDVSWPALACALVQMALRAGCSVYATYFSQEMKGLLEPLQGVHLMDSRAGLELGIPSHVAFRVMLTNGSVDLGAVLQRFVDRGAHLALLPGRASTYLAAIYASLVSKGLTVSYLDPWDMTSCNQINVSSAMRDAVHLLQHGLVARIPSDSFDLSRFSDAAAAVNASPVRAVLTCDPEATLVPIKQTPEPLTFDGNGTYLLIGCLGGLGRSLTIWMISRGARNFIFLSRSGADKPEAAALMADLRGMGQSQTCKLSLQVARGDVSRREDVAAAISLASTPIRGVIQAAMVLHELIFNTMSLQQWNQVIQPKVLGTMHLDELLAYHDLDFFVMTSSVLGAIGAATQSNYSAANAYLDAMARHRHSRGLQATSLALGMVLEVGHVEEHPEVEVALKRNGMYGIGVTTMLVLGPAMSLLSVSMVYSNYDHLCLEVKPCSQDRCGRGAAAETGGIEAVKAVVQQLLMGHLSKLVLLPVQKMRPQTPLSVYGMDSMISAELRNWTWKEFKADVPFMSLLDQSLTFERLAEQVVGVMDRELRDSLNDST
ncbi:Beta-ketoacyl synthase [Ophiocordyceps sinensis CO18]|uniref:Beta-ketoacyl synthase n=1 Tax=Ophiocordyceps sinensis (strain Co18 / CGMCC 3.14243) TaxID=911162 RepID=T5A5F3_OPHSC|nr:Beta-ketoacyl synthase [Ophiocordyceps sinensis CO18]